MTIQLNKEQEQVAQEFLGFLLTDEPEFTLSGGAGVGKTTLVNHLIGSMGDYNAVLEVIGRKGLKDIIVTATTNKAAEVIGSATGMDARTVHNAFGLVIENDFSNGRTKIKKGRNHTVIHDSLIIIDEASMEDTPLLNAIYSSTVNCKLMHIGDRRQMAPIYEPISPVFANPKNIHYLTQRMRNRGAPALMALCDQLEQTVDTGIFKPMLPVPGVIEYLDNRQMEAMLNQEFLTPLPDSRIMCYTNNKVLQYNSHLRFAMGLPAQFQVGEIAVAGCAVRTGTAGVNPEQQVTIMDVSAPVINPDLHANYGYEVETYGMHTSRGYFCQPTNSAHLQQCIKHAAAQKNWPAYFFMKEAIGDFRMPHAATVYKAQGSSYQNSFIDLADIGACHNADQVARMLYVAVSRAQERVYFYGKLPPKYAG